MFMNSSRDEITFQQQSLVTYVSIGFRPPCQCPSEGHQHGVLIELYKFRQNISPNISHMKNCTDLNLGEDLCIFTFFHFPDNGPYLLNGFHFHFRWRDSENQQQNFGTFNDKRHWCIGSSSLFVSCDNSNPVFCCVLYTT